MKPTTNWAEFLASLLNLWCDAVKDEDSDKIALEEAEDTRQ
ncbi:MAG: hypothetical protein RLO50_15650 [Azospirillaceae bacterium]